MRKQLVMLLVVLALLAVPVAAEEKNWTYSFDCSGTNVDATLGFGCNLLATDQVDEEDTIRPPQPPGVTGYSRMNIYDVDGSLNTSNSFYSSINAPLSVLHEDTGFILEISPDDNTPTEPYTITWNPVDADYLSTITSITLVNLTDPSDTYDMMVSGSATGTSYMNMGGTDFAFPRTYSINVTYDLPAPVADFSANQTSISVGDTVTFTDESTGIIDSYLWNFGAGEGTSTDQNSTHVYNTQGTYNVTLTATNEAGDNTKTISDYITVTGPPPEAPVADFTYEPASPQVGVQVNFTDTSTNTPTMWAWDFGDGAIATMTANPKHTYAVAGTYTVNLTASNIGGLGSFQDTVTVAVQEAPVANFSGTPTTGVAPFTVDFTDTSTGYNITDWAWTFGAGESTSTDSSPSHVYTNEGVYDVSLTVTNDGGSDVEDKVGYIIVTGPAPTALFTTNSTTGEAPLTVSFTDTSEAYAGATISTWLWNFGTGEGTSAAQSPVHTYSSPGSYNVTLTVTDDATTPASNTSDVTNIMVFGPAPVANFSGAPTLVSVMNGIVNFTDLSTSADFNVSTWDWAFGDGGTSAVQNPDYLYTAKGTYTVSLTVADDQIPAKTNATTKINYIEVVDEPTADFTWPTAPAVVEGYPSAMVNYTDISVAEGSAVIDAWAWDFGAAGSSAVQAPGNITFSTAGWYDVSLNVTDNAGGYNEVTKERIVHVLNDSPVASFTATPLTGDAPLAVTFTDASTGGPVETYAWTFGDGGTSAAASPVYTYTTPGIWNASLTVTNDGGSSTSTETQFNVTQPPVPIPDFTASTTSGRSPLTVQFNESISGSWDSVLWEFGDTGTVYTSTEADPEFTFIRVGKHTVSLTAYNAVGNMTETKVDYINVGMPISSGDNDDSGSSAVTPAPTAVPTSSPGDVNPTQTPRPTAEPTEEITPEETATPVTPVPTATSETTPIPTTTPGFGIIVAVLGSIAALVVMRR